MSPAEAKAVRTTIRGLYSMFHCCGLRKEEITDADKARGLKVGQLCDDCEQSIEAHMQDIAKATTTQGEGADHGR